MPQRPFITGIMISLLLLAIFYSVTVEGVYNNAITNMTDNESISGTLPSTVLV